ncbi:protein kinase domain-containing protein [Mariniblastus fucicola]|uniref:non-specific serine/threonine protein kinase n=1 Tax=Mariniblastus fucicola TaxID=980251 RepID=A0A5B9P8Z6_9BACT|nr:serine/threonine-protein kinase [Mariniblastus fucicola]QEG21919.1 Serine/threonine-protein kinase PknB [Mariniblastus fucicola]
MTEDKHVSRDELLEMLGGEHESPHTNRIGEHVHQCSSCRDKLDELAAKSAIWNKAPELLKSNVPLQGNLGSNGIETTDLPSDVDKDSDQAQWSWPIDSLLDAPRHPEMLGRIGDYDIEREIGRGGMGIVLKAHEAELNRPLAIKVLAPHLASHGTARQRFAHEARAAAGVIHPNVIAVHRVENSGKNPYIVMPYIAGPSMQTLVEQRGPLPEEEIVRMTLQISAGLTAAHSQGLVHRDIKPANILVADGGNRVMITDFGLARAEDDASLTRTGWLTGTPNYMSPEQTRGERLDHRSDLFSLGSLIYFLATGRLPFRSESPLGVLRRIQEDHPTPVRQVNRNTSKTLADIIDVLLEKEPEDRFQSAAELHEVLSKQMFFLHQPDVSHPPVVKKKLASATPRRRTYWGGLLAGALLLGAAGYGLMPPAEQSDTAANEDNEMIAQVWATAESFDQATPTAQGQLAQSVSPMSVDDADRDWLQVDVTSEEHGQVGLVVIEPQEDDELSGQQAFEKGNANFHEGNYKQAIAYYKISTDDDHFRGMSRYNLGCAYALTEEPEKAMDELELAIDAGYDRYEKFKDDSDLAALRETDRFKDILAELKEIQQSRELLDKAMVMVGQEKYEQAVTMIREVMEIDGENEKAWLNLGYALHMQGKYDEAMEWHQKSANGKDHVALGNYNMACVFALRDNSDAAFKSLNSALDSGLAESLSMSHIKEDSDLKSLRDDDRFKEFIKRFTLEECKSEDSRFFLTDGSIKVSSSRFTIDLDSEEWNEEIEGEWKGELFDESFDLQIISEHDDSTWTWVYSHQFASNDFAPALKDKPEGFELSKRFGKLVFDGSFDGSVGSGDFEFIASDSFRQKLESDGIKSASDALLLQLFLSPEDETELIGKLKTFAKLELKEGTVDRLMLSGVDAVNVVSWRNAGLDVDANLDYIALNIDPDDFKEYANNFDIKDVRVFIESRVPVELLKSYRDADLNLKEYGSFAHGRVPASSVAAYRDAGFDVSKLEDLIHTRVPVSLVKRYREAGLNPQQHIEQLLQRISPAKLKRMQK